MAFSKQKWKIQGKPFVDDITTRAVCRGDSRSAQAVAFSFQTLCFSPSPAHPAAWERQEVHLAKRPCGADHVAWTELGRFYPGVGRIWNCPRRYLVIKIWSRIWTKESPWYLSLEVYLVKCVFFCVCHCFFFCLCWIASIKGLTAEVDGESHFTNVSKDCCDRRNADPAISCAEATFTRSFSNCSLAILFFFGTALSLSRKRIRPHMSSWWWFTNSTKPQAQKPNFTG